MATGASNLVPKMIEAGLTQEPVIVNKLSLKDWVIIANVFSDWPFRPQVRPSLLGRSKSDAESPLIADAV